MTFKESRAEKMQGLMKQLEEGVASVYTSDEYKAYLRFVANFYDYSANNCILIEMQCPQASFVAGYKTWQKMGRYVKKGEKAIKIIAPSLKKKTTLTDGEESETMIKRIDGGITAPKGFLAAGLRAGIKPGKTNKDMAMIYSEVPATVAGTFTRNRVTAAPVQWDRKIVEEQETAQAVVVNTGIANAATGAEGLKNSELTAEEAGKVLRLPKEQVLVASTGVIGFQLPMDVILEGVSKLAPERIAHTWVEVFYKDKWIALEGVITDEAYVRGVKKRRPDKRGAFKEYAISVRDLHSLDLNWKGEDLFVQNTSVVEDYGVFESPDDFFKEHGQTWNMIKDFAYVHYGRKVMNRNVSRIRQSGM